MVLISVIRDYEKLKPIRQEWEDLLERSHSNNLFLTWDWVSTWIENYQVENKLVCLTVTVDNRLVAIAPLWIDEIRYAGILSAKVLRFIGSEEICSDYLDIIIDESGGRGIISKIWDFLFGQIGDEWDFFEYHSVPDNSIATDTFANLAIADKRCFRSEINGYAHCPFMKLPDTWEIATNEFSRKKRYSINRYRRILSERGEVDFRVVSNPDELSSEMDRFISLNQRSWNEKDLPGNFATDTFEDFHRTAARKLLQNDRLFLASLYVNNKHLASFYGFIYNNVMYNYITSVDKQFDRRISVGRVFLSMCIETAIERKCVEFDFLRGSEEYKYHWASHERRNVSITFYNNKVNTWAYLVVLSTRQVLKQLIRNIFGEKAGLVRKKLRGFRNRNGR